jgi:O-antigen biosynthesis protein
VTGRMKVYVVGDREGLYSARLHEAREMLNAAARDRVVIVPETGDAALYYSAADLFVCTSRVESFPRVILEAMACGLPVVTTPINGIPEQVQEKVNAFFYPPGDTKSLAKAVKKLVADDGLRAKMARNSRYVIDTLTDYDTMVAAYGETFREAWLSGGPR